MGGGAGSGSPSQESLLPRVVRGFAWNVASQLVLQGSRIAVLLVVARLVTPREYGLAAIAVAAAAIVPSVFDFGFGAALVQRTEISELDTATAFWTSAAGGIVLAGSGIALSGAVASFFGEPRVRGLFAVLALGFLPTALASTQSALLTREMRYRALESIAMTTTLVGAATAIGIAAGGGGPWAIVGQSVVGSFTSAALLWLASSWRPPFRYSRASLRMLAGFGGGLMATRFLVYLQRTVDNLLVGRVLGPAKLGAYGLAYNLVLVPFGRVVDPVRRVLFPAFSRLQDDRSRTADAWLRGTRLLVAIVLPAVLGLAAVAPEFVDVVLGRRWHDAIPVIRILAVAAAVQIFVSLNAVVLTSLGRVTTVLRFYAFSTALVVASFAAGVSYGIEGVAAGFAVANALTAPVYLRITLRALGVPASRLRGALAGVVEAALAMLAAVLAARLLVSELTASEAVELAVAVVVGVAVYAPVCAWRSPEVLRELRRVLAVRRGSPAAP